VTGFGWNSLSDWWLTISSSPSSSRSSSSGYYEVNKKDVSRTLQGKKWAHQNRHNARDIMLNETNERNNTRDDNSGRWGGRRGGAELAPQAPITPLPKFQDSNIVSPRHICFDLPIQTVISWVTRHIMNSVDLTYRYACFVLPRGVILIQPGAVGCLSLLHPGKGSHTKYGSLSCYFSKLRKFLDRNVRKSWYTFSGLLWTS